MSAFNSIRDVCATPHARPVTGWLVAGADGMLGRELAEVLTAAGVTDAVVTDQHNLDVTDAVAVRSAVSQLGDSGVVLNAAAWTNVDAAEDHEDLAQAVNATAVEVLATACHEAGAVLIHVSTDYVFGGADSGTDRAQSPAGYYAEDDPTAPINAYGRTKLDGELAVRRICPASGYVLRTAWLYGRHGRNFVSTVLGLAATRETIEVVNDQIGQPTWTHDVASRMVEIAYRSPPPGIYHATSAGQTSWHGLAQAAFVEAGLDPERVRPVDSSAFPRPAPRPARSVLSHHGWSRAGLEPLRGWREMLAAAFRSGAFEASGGQPGSAVKR